MLYFVIYGTCWIVNLVPGESSEPLCFGSEHGAIPCFEFVGRDHADVHAFTFPAPRHATQLDEVQ